VIVPLCMILQRCTPPIRRMSRLPNACIVHVTRHGMAAGHRRGSRSPAMFKTLFKSGLSFFLGLGAIAQSYRA
jgi:hypothetical protein